MKRLLIMGGVGSAREIVSQAHKMGIEVLVTDFLESSPAKKVADMSFMASATDVDAVASLAKREKVDGVLTGYVDMLLPYYVRVCEKAGLPCYATEEQIAVATDKARFKALCREFGVATVPECSQADALAGRAKFPLLAKPADNSGSRGVFICNSPQELRQNCEKALKFSGTGQVLIEQYMTCNEATVFYFFHEGEPYLTAVGNRHTLRFDERLLPLPVGYTFPAQSLAAFEGGAAKNVAAMFKALGMKEGMAFMQCFVEGGSYIVYEMGYRLTGSREYHLIAHATGFNPLAALIDFAVGNPIDSAALKEVSPRKGITANVSLLARPGKVSSFEGIEDVRKMDGVIHVYTSYEPGAAIGPEVMGRLAQVAVRVLLYADSKAELVEQMERAKGAIKMLDEGGADMLIKNYSYYTLCREWTEWKAL